MLNAHHKLVTALFVASSSSSTLSRTMSSTLDTSTTHRKTFVTLGMFIIDEFSYSDEHGNPPESAKNLPPQESIRIGGGGTYAAIGARVWLPPSPLSMIIDTGSDFPPDILEALRKYDMTSASGMKASNGSGLFTFRSNPSHPTTRALNSYRGDRRDFKYLTPRIRITPKDVHVHVLQPSSDFEVGSNQGVGPEMVHFICSPTRAMAIVNEARDLGWNLDLDPTLGLAGGQTNTITIYEPIPDRCVPEELPALKAVLPYIHILSPNAEESLSILSIPHPSSPAASLKPLIEFAASQLLSLGMPSQGAVIIRSGELGAYILTHHAAGRWVPAFWNDGTSEGRKKVVDVTGAGNSFLGGLAAGLKLSGGDVFEATLYASVSASFVIEQSGLPSPASVSADEGEEKWNGDLPRRRLGLLRARCAQGPQT